MPIFPYKKQPPNRPILSPYHPKSRYPLPNGEKPSGLTPYDATRKGTYADEPQEDL